MRKTLEKFAKNQYNYSDCREPENFDRNVCADCDLNGDCETFREYVKMYENEEMV